MKKNIRRSVMIAAIAMLLTAFLGITGVQAKTISSAKAENVFFYTENASGKAVLLKVIPLEELKAISHGQLAGGMTGADTGTNYNISTTDNYPTTQYCEAKGITVPELVEYVKKVTTVPGASAISFSGKDVINLMATDSYGSYGRSWTYDQLYGTKRYYFEKLYDPTVGWKTGWEIAGEDNSKFGIDLNTYNSKYKASDPYYENKRTVFASGAETVPVLATESLSGRTTTATLNASTELGIADYIRDNKGIVAGSLSKALEDTWSLRLSLPMTESDLMAAHRTAYDNFKWIYNMRLNMAVMPDIVSQGTVAVPQAEVTVSPDSKTLNVTLSCATQGASIYYSYDGAPQIPYEKPLSADITGRNLSSNPVTFYMTAVKEGYDDAGIITAKYPGLAPAFTSLYSGLTGQNVVFSAASGLRGEDWSAWIGALTSVALKTPSAGGYLTISKSKYLIDNSAKTITFDKSLFTEAGSYSFIFHASKYADKNLSLSMKKSTPKVAAEGPYYTGAGLKLTFTDNGYQTGLTVYIKLPDGTATMISPTYLDRSVPGQVTVKPEYYDSNSCKIKEPGAYTLELSNTGYSPDTQEVGIIIQSGSGFSDVIQDAWYFDAVKYVSVSGLFSGTGNKSFSPAAPMTRAMFVTVLSRLAKADTGSYTKSDFTDVDMTSWYGPSVMWAANNKLAGGMTEGFFDPSSSVSREQLVTMLYRYSMYDRAATEKRQTSAPDDAAVRESAVNNNSVTDQNALNGFADVGQVSGWARDAMSWAIDKEIIKGSGGLLNPKGAATRAQVATIFMNYDKLHGIAIPGSSQDSKGGETL